MAQYKHKKSEDNFLKYVIIGFVVVIVGLTAWSITWSALDAPEVPDTLLDYDDFDQVGAFESIENFNDEVFGVYYYSESCPACKVLKPKILIFADDNSFDMPIYLMDAYGTLGDKDIVVGPLGETLRYTPTLLIYNNGVLTQFIVSAEEIAAYIDDVES